jgi:uncharacterized protein (DUF302 family)
MNSMDYHYTVESEKTIEEAILSLERNLKEYKFGILWQMDIPEKLQEKGVLAYTNPYRILEVCNPQEAANVLNQNEMAGYFLPCKIAVYKSNGQTKIGFPSPYALVSMLNDNELKKIAKSIEDTLIKVLNQSK